MIELKPPAPRLEILCHVAVKVVAPQLIGAVLTGERRIIPIIGGRFEGPKMRGEMEMKVEGVQGPQCADVAKTVTELIGAPEHEENTSEFYAHAVVKLQVQNKKKV